MKIFIVCLMILNFSSCALNSKKENSGRMLHSIEQDLSSIEENKQSESWRASFGPYIDRSGLN